MRPKSFSPILRLIQLAVKSPYCDNNATLIPIHISCGMNTSAPSNPYITDANVPHRMPAICPAHVLCSEIRSHILSPPIKRPKNHAPISAQQIINSNNNIIKKFIPSQLKQQWRFKKNNSVITSITNNLPQFFR